MDYILFQYLYSSTIFLLPQDNITLLKILNNECISCGGHDPLHSLWLPDLKSNKHYLVQYWY